MILNRYITKSILQDSLVALFVLVAVFLFFTLVDQLDNTRGDYGILQAIQYVLLMLPRFIYELLANAVLIGGLVTFGRLASNSEWIVIRVAGISRLYMVHLVLKISAIFIVASLLLSEWIVPFCEQVAQQHRSHALYKKVSLKTQHGFWSREGNSYINIKNILHNDLVADISIYELTTDGKLKSYTTAKSAQYDGSRWTLYDTIRTDINHTEISSSKHPQVDWQVSFSPELIDTITLKPHYLSIANLLEQISYLSENDQDVWRYQQALWIKFMHPLEIIAMLLLALCLVPPAARNIGSGQHIFIGVLIGVTFHLINQMSNHFGIIYGIPTILSASLPTVLVLLYIVHRLRKSY